MDTLKDILNNPKLVVLSFENQVWIQAKEAVESIGLSNVKEVLKENVSPKYIKTFDQLPETFQDDLNNEFGEKTIFIREAGLYQLILKDMRSIATKPVKKWILETVMPSARAIINPHFGQNLNSKQRHLSLESYYAD